MKHYTDQHEWLSIDGETATVGISHFAQNQLGDVVYVDLPEVGRSVEQKEEVCVVESVKAASEIYAPASGTITEVNEALNDAPDTINSMPESEGWLFKMKLSNKAELDSLMTETAYQDMVA